MILLPIYDNSTCFERLSIKSPARSLAHSGLAVNMSLPLALDHSQSSQPSRSAFPRAPPQHHHPTRRSLPSLCLLLPSSSSFRDLGMAGRKVKKKELKPPWLPRSRSSSAFTGQVLNWTKAIVVVMSPAGEADLTPF